MGAFAPKREMLRNFIRRNIRRTSSDTTKSNSLKSLLVSSAVIGGAGAIILDIPKVYENVLSLIIGNNPERFKSYHDIRLYLLENVFSGMITNQYDPPQNKPLKKIPKIPVVRPLKHDLVLGHRFQ